MDKTNLNFSSWRMAHLEGEFMMVDENGEEINDENFGKVKFELIEYLIARYRREQPEVTNFLLQRIYESLDAVEWLIALEFEMPALMVIYSSIDTLASLSIEAGKEVKKADFISWANKYVIPRLEYKCSGEDLYSARCSILHTLSSESGLSRKGAAKELVYITRGYSEERTVKVYNELYKARKQAIDKDDTLLVNIDDLAEAVLEGFEEFVAEHREASEFKKRMEHRLNKTYVSKYID